MTVVPTFFSDESNGSYASLKWGRRDALFVIIQKHNFNSLFRKVQIVLLVSAVFLFLYFSSEVALPVSIDLQTAAVIIYYNVFSIRLTVKSYIALPLTQFLSWRESPKFSAILCFCCAGKNLPPILTTVTTTNLVLDTHGPISVVLWPILTNEVSMDFRTTQGCHWCEKMWFSCLPSNAIRISLWSSSTFTQFLIWCSWQM